MIMQVVSAFECFSVGKQLVHGSLDLHSVFVTELEGHMKV